MRTGFRWEHKIQDASGTGILGNALDDPRALSTSAFSNSMHRDDCRKSLAPQLTSMAVFLRESKAFRRMKESVGSKLCMASRLAFVSPSRNSQIRPVPTRLHEDRDQETCYTAFTCFAHECCSSTVLLMLKHFAVIDILLTSSLR